jgi:NIMA (never in mitosis gene a)-related kinase
MARAGDAVGPYKVQRVLGRGSFSTVLLGQNPIHPECQYALKVIACDHVDKNLAARAMKEAIAEAELLQRLRHPNIVSCYQVCWDIQRCAVWLALDYMDGGDLKRLIDSWCAFSSTVAMNPGMYQAPLLRRVLVALCRALIYMHNEGVLHRDVKPSNVLLAQSTQEIRLADFGLSKILEATGRARSTVGTPYYLSPELVSGEPYGPASDSWAAGICLYELAALERPFKASNQLALALQIAEDEAPPLPEGCAQDIVDVIAGLLRKDQFTRLQLRDAMNLLRQDGAELENSFDIRPQQQCCAFGVIGSLSKGATTASGMKLVASPCFAGHALQRFQVPSDKQLKCDMCHRDFSHATFRWGCRTCSFSMCEACGQGEAEWKIIATDEGDEPT